MKKILLGSTALLGFGLMSSSALAQVELSISGNMRFEAGYVNEDNDADDERDYAFRQDGVLQFNAAGTADNGLEFGGEAEIDDLRSDGSNGDLEIDELYVYVGGGFGQVRLGDKEGAVANFAVTAPTTGSGGFDGNYGQYIDEAGSYLLNLEDNDNTRISYFTPEIAGFQGGVSFTPTAVAGKSGTASRAFEGSENIIDGAANYSLNVGGFDLLVGGGLVWGQNSGPGDDLFGYQAGINVGFGGFTVGAGYFAYTETPSTQEQSTIQAGATYEIGPWTIGASAAFDEREIDGLGSADTKIYAVGGTYAVAPGLSVYADLMYVDADEWLDLEDFVEGTLTGVAANEATVFVVGTSVSF